MAFSHGFSPHPKISYAGAAPTGAASEAEYLEISLTHERDAEQVRAALDEALPTGLDVLEVVVAGPGSLAERLEASEWRIALPGVDPEVAGAAVEAFLAREEILVERMTKRGVRSFDCRAAVLRLTVASEPGSVAACAILQVVLRHGTPAVRPDDVLAGLRTMAGLEAQVAPFHERLAQGPLDAENGTVGDPLALNRDTA